ncbi:hypothetical protein EDB87DRAFT_1687457 [Lactarius vividus]|nr:hypothetical protein EDB87DRAFT_1687457 [Lactarius vividus]
MAGSVVSESKVTTIPNSAARANPEKGQDTLLVDRYDLTDPDNPQNWSSWRKAWVVFRTCFLTFAVYLGASVPTAGISGVASEFHNTSLYRISSDPEYITGPMVWSPLSEVPQIGRMPIYILTLTMFVVLQVPTALTTNWYVHGLPISYRFLRFADSCDGRSDHRRSLRSKEAGLWNDKFMAFSPLPHRASVGWSVASLPIAKVGVGQSGRSRSSLVPRSSCYSYFPETSAANILRRRARRLRKATGNPSVKSASEMAAAAITPRDVAEDVLVYPFALNFQEPTVLILNVYVALIYAHLYIFFESSRSFSLASITGVSRFSTFLLRRFRRHLRGHTSVLLLPVFRARAHVQRQGRAEARGADTHRDRWRALVLPVCLVRFGWRLRASMHWIVPIIGSTLFGITALLLFNAVLNYLADPYPAYAANVLAGNDCIRSMFGPDSLFSLGLCVTTSVPDGGARSSHSLRMPLFLSLFCFTHTPMHVRRHESSFFAT